MSKRTKPEPLSESDGYEQRYMNASNALARSRMFMPWWFHVLVLGALGSVFFRQQSLVAALVIAPMILLAWLLFMSLRVLVTKEAVHVQFGLFGPKIPMSAIVDAREEAYSAMKYGGWGIRFGLDGSRAYSVPASGDRGLLIRYVNEKGTTKSVFVSARDPGVLLAAIDKARAAVPRARIARQNVIGAADEVEDEALSERSERRRQNAIAGSGSRPGSLHARVGPGGRPSVQASLPDSAWRRTPSHSRGFCDPARSLPQGGSGSSDRRDVRRGVKLRRQRDLPCGRLPSGERISHDHDCADRAIVNATSGASRIPSPLGKILRRIRARRCGGST